MPKKEEFLTLGASRTPSDCPWPSEHELITVGLCCMKKKAESAAMKDIVCRLEATGPFKVVNFPENLILSQPPTDWPQVDCCIPFFSTGFPLEKAIEYAKLNPDTFFLTEPASQKALLDRRAVYAGLRRNNIPLVRHVFCSRDGTSDPPVVVEEVDFISVNGVVMKKPFVEKPVDSEDHNIRIYYHTSDGGGSTHLFRKIGDKSSEFFADQSRIRQEGSYVYEEFVKTEGKVDIKVYTAGLRFQHGEARKSPVVDGVVQRDDKGKEVRCRIQLSDEEQIIAMKIVKAFRQKVCGFDLLRSTEGVSYVCDVNGWSFVKGDEEYCAKVTEIMKNMFLEEVHKRGLHRLVLPVSKESMDFVKANGGDRNLVGVVCVLRHADRTPKQKIKIKLTHQDLIEIGFPAEKVDQKSEAVFKGAHPVLKQILAKCEGLLAPDGGCPPKDVDKLKLVVDVLSQHREGLKIQLKPQSWSETGKCLEVQMVCKWGGWITESGMQQAQNLGVEFVNRVFRNDPGTYTKDMMVFSNNERRVIATAETFSKALLQSDKIPGGVQIREDLLGNCEPAKAIMDAMKTRIHDILHIRTEAEIASIIHMSGLADVCDIVGLKSRTPYGAMMYTRDLIHRINSVIHDGLVLARGESVALFRQRWALLDKSFYNAETDTFDCSKIPDIFDYINYDVCYNQETLAPLDLFPIFEAAEALASFVTDAEYGITKEDKLTIGALVASPLLSRISADVSEMMKMHRKPKCRMYFTSESHLHTLKNCLYHAGNSKFHELKEPVSLHYLTHLVFKVYNYPTSMFENISPIPSPLPSRPGTPLMASPVHPNQTAACQHQIEVQFSGGIDKNMFGILQDHHTEYAAVTPMIRIHNNLAALEFQEIVATAVSTAAFATKNVST